MINNKLRIAAALLAMSAAGSTLAAVSAEEAKQLGTTLTPWGAEKAGNKDGTIPEYTGEKLKAPPGFNPKKIGQVPDPWNEKPLFSITAQNYTQYADRLTEGHKGMFKTYPDYRMDIYPTHRTHVYPKHILDNTMKNATSCKTINKELQLEGCYGGVPFPIPKTGNEVMWNHSVRWVAPNFGGKFMAIYVDPKGKWTNQGQNEVWYTQAFFDPKRTTPWPSDADTIRLRFDAYGPARKIGEKYLFISSLDSLNKATRVWSYIPGQRRVKLAPDLAYDTPSPISGGTQTMDDSYGFFGALDRYDFKLAGKKEVFINYNDFKTTDRQQCSTDKFVRKNFPNPDCVRYELHRTWVVNATLKPGYRHIYQKRTMYFDEDNYGAGSAETYDSSGKLYRVSDVTSLPFLDPNAGSLAESTFSMDLQTGAWTHPGVSGDADTGWIVRDPVDQTFYSPESMAAEGIR